jgi:hypothetical protein
MAAPRKRRRDCNAVVAICLESRHLNVLPSSDIANTGRRQLRALRHEVVERPFFACGSRASKQLAVIFFNPDLRCTRILRLGTAVSVP